MSVRVVKRNLETRIQPIPIGIKYMCMETKRHQELIHLQKLTEAHTEEIMEDKV